MRFCVYYKNGASLSSSFSYISFPTGGTGNDTGKVLRFQLDYVQLDAFPVLSTNVILLILVRRHQESLHVAQRAMQIATC